KTEEEDVRNLSQCTFREHNTGPQYAQYRWNVKKEIAGSVFLSAGCHAVDALRHFVRQEVVEVMAYSNQLNKEYEYPTNVVGIVKLGAGRLERCPPPSLSNVPMLSISIFWARRARSGTTTSMPRSSLPVRPTGSRFRPSAPTAGMSNTILSTGR